MLARSLEVASIRTAAIRSAVALPVSDTSSDVGTVNRAHSRQHEGSYAQLPITASMFSVRLCSAVPSRIAFRLLRGESRISTLNIIDSSWARSWMSLHRSAVRRPIGIGGGGGAATESVASPGTSDCRPETASSAVTPPGSHLRPDLRPERRRCDQAVTIMLSGSFDGMPLSRGNARRGSCAEHNRTLNIQAGQAGRVARDALLANLAHLGVVGGPAAIGIASEFRFAVNAGAAPMPMLRL